jgi:putative endonuclease
LSNRRGRGKRGEAEAAAYLAGKGYTVAARNYGKRTGEIDIIARDPRGTLVFVEVKAAWTGHAGDPAFRVNKKKQKTIGRLAAFYLAEKGLGEPPCRFDVVTVDFKAGPDPVMTHYENAFMLV